MMRLQVAAACLLVMSASGAVEQQPPPSSAKSASASAPGATAAPRRARVVTELSGFELIEARALSKQTTVAGASRGSRAVLSVAPHLATVFSVRPSLSWFSDVDSGQTYIVRAYNEDEEKVHEARVSGPVYRYPDTSPALKAGSTYYWSVEIAGLPESRSEMRGMRVIDGAARGVVAAEASRISGEDEAAHLSRARVFIEHRVWYDALAACDSAVARAPHSAVAHERRAELLAQIPHLEPLAEAAFARADALQRRDR